MNNKIIREVLICPVYHSALVLTEDKRTLRCTGEKPHCFDIASSGYVNLASPKQAGTGDSKELVRARSKFLAAGYYKPFADAVCSMVKKYADSGVVIDAGCGEGYYSVQVSKAAGCDLCGFDLSKPAIEAAAKAAGRAGSDAIFCVAGIFDMPLKSGCADIVINLFAPCAENEFLRVLKQGGYLITAGAGPNHLYGLKTALYDNPVKNEPRADLPYKMELIEKTNIKFNFELQNHDDIVALFSMTPYYYRTGKTGFDRLEKLDRLETEADIELFVYKKEI